MLLLTPTETDDLMAAMLAKFPSPQLAIVLGGFINSALTICRRYVHGEALRAVSLVHRPSVMVSRPAACSADCGAARATERML